MTTLTDILNIRRLSIERSYLKQQETALRVQIIRAFMAAHRNQTSSKTLLSNVEKMEGMVSVLMTNNDEFFDVLDQIETELGIN